jgi:hypothetical protein
MFIKKIIYVNTDVLHTQYISTCHGLIILIRVICAYARPRSSGTGVGNPRGVWWSTNAKLRGC